MLERGKNLITLHEELSKHFVLAGYASFAKAISEYKSIPKERQYKINNAKKEYQKLGTLSELTKPRIYGTFEDAQYCMRTLSLTFDTTNYQYDPTTRELKFTDSLVFVENK